MVSNISGLAGRLTAAGLVGRSTAAGLAGRSTAAVLSTRKIELFIVDGRLIWLDTCCLIDT